MFERHLKQANPNSRKIEYGVDELFEYIEDMTDFVALVYVFCLSYTFSPRFRYSQKTESYLPKNKKWIKDALLRHIRSGINN